MPVRLRRLGLIYVCLGTLSAGCVTTQEPPGSFATGGPGQYGQPAPGATPVATETTGLGSLFGFKGKSKPSPQLNLAYARFEESRAIAAPTKEEQKEHLALARKSYQDVLTADGKSVDAVIGLARLDEAAGRIPEAEQGFNKAVKLESASPRTLDALAQFYAHQKRWHEADLAYDKALATSPDDKVIRHHHAEALARAGQLDRAESEFAAVGGPATAHYNVGYILYEQGEIAASEEQFVAALSENPRLEQAQQMLKKVRADLEKSPATVTASAVGGSASKPRPAASALRTSQPAGPQAARR